MQPRSILGESRILGAVSLCAILFLPPGGALAQDAGAEASRPWEVIVSLGAPLAAPSDEIEAAMAGAGFGDESFGTDHPFSSSSEVAWAASVRRRIRPRVDVELLATRATMGTTLGYHGTGFATGHHLFLSHSVTTIAPLARYRLGAAHVGAGPAAGRVRIERTDSQGESLAEDTEAWKLGAVLDAGLSVPQDSRLFFEGRAQYRWLPATEVGPFTGGNGLPDDIPSTLPAFEVDMSHAYLSVGMGVRL